MAKKYWNRYASCMGKKCSDCEKLPPKCISNNKKYFFYSRFQRSTVLTLISNCCARQLLSIQLDFETQKCVIEELIASNRGVFPHLTLYYPKFHCELNHIEQFWCHGKQKARDMCDYTLEGLKKHVPIALESVLNSTILDNYKSCLQKMELYRQSIGYDNAEWKKLILHQKIYVIGNNC